MNLTDQILITMDTVKEATSIDNVPVDSETTGPAPKATGDAEVTEGAEATKGAEATCAEGADATDGAVATEGAEAAAGASGSEPQSKAHTDDVSDADSEQLLFNSPKPPTKEHQLLDDEIKTPLFVTSTKTYAAHHKRKSRASFSTKRITSALTRESTYMLRVKQRMDALDAIVSGLQGGIMKLVDSVDAYKEKTEQSVIQTRESISSLVKEILPTPRKGSNPVDNKPVLEMLKTHQQKIEKKIDVLSGRISQIEQCASQLKRVGKLELMLENLSAQLQNVQSKHCASCKCSEDIVVLNSDLQDMKQELCQQVRESGQDIASLKQTVLHAEDRTRQMNEQILKVLQEKTPNDVTLLTSAPPLATHSGSRNLVDTTSTVRPKTTVKPAMQNTESVSRQNSHRPANVHQPSTSSLASLPGHTGRANLDRPSSEKLRKVLLMGDSATKAIDKRYLLRHETVSKCRAATVSDAYVKIKTGTDNVKGKVIFCVGLNDLRQGTEVTEIVQDMRGLIEETIYRHPQCYIYLCSILPVNCPGVTRDKITRLNAGLENLQNLWERVFYVNTMTAFMNHNSPGSLFEMDHVHPNKDGVAVLMNSIRKKVESGQKSFHQFTSKPATPSTFSYASCASAAPIDKASVTSSCMGHVGLRDGERKAGASWGRSMQESNQHHRLSPNRLVSDPRRLDSVDEHARVNRDTITRGQCAQKHPVLPPSFPYQRYHPELRPSAMPWQGHFPYPHMISPAVYYPREMSDSLHYYV